MSPDNNPVKPTPFEAIPAAAPTGSAQEGSTTAADKSPPAWVVPALGALVVLALVVVFLLPSLVEPPSASSPATETESASTEQDSATSPSSSNKPKTPVEEASPWSDAQLARLRKEAQEVLGELLDVQARLEERGVEQWAPEPFQSALASAQAADELYKTREFEQATQGYREALAALQALENGIPDALAAQQSAALDAIEALEPEAAEQALTLAELLGPGDTTNAGLQARVSVLPQLIESIQTAQAAEADGDLVQALSELDTAVGLDGQHTYAAQEQARVSQALLTRNFNDAMSDGYTALDEGRFDTARKAFNRAAGLVPGSSEAATALAEVASAQTASRLTRLRASGERAENSESWADAVKAYEEALAIDSNLLYATEGLQRAQPRARLDKQFRTALEDPNRLSDINVANATQQLLDQAKRLSPRGPILAQQISGLEQALAKANTELPVTLRSDGATQVTVFKVARLGTFNERQLSLRPGTYTAVGTRTGYRDVRRTFTLSHNGGNDPILIACTEPI